MAPDLSIVYASIRELQHGYEKQEFSPVEVVEQLLARIEQIDPHMHAFSTVCAAEALEAARRCESDLLRGHERGPLHGIPFAAKDLYDTEGIRTTYGSRLFEHNVGSADAAAVRRLKDAGAILIGKTATHEFAWGITTVNRYFGPTRNPWQPARVPGGSSGGSAVALATGMVPAALGTDTGGSIRIPAAFCGVVGLKPTYRRVSATGVFPLAPSLDHPGPLARTVEDAALLLSVLAGGDPGDHTAESIAVPDFARDLHDGVASLRIGVCPDLHLVPPTKAVQRVFEQSVAIFSGIGARIREVTLPTAAQIGEAYTSIQMAEAYHVHHHQHGLFPARRSEYGPDVAERLDKAREVTLPMYLDALQVQRRVKADFARLFDREIDVLLTPIAAGPPVVIGDDDVTVEGRTVPFRTMVLPYTTPQDLAGLPACAVRAGFDDEGVPIGMQITGPQWCESVVLRACYAYVEATDTLQQRWPEIQQ